MKRRTPSRKALAAALLAAERFQSLEMMAVAPWRAEKIKAKADFVPVSQYPRGQVPQVNEFGRDAKYRYVNGG